QVAIGCTSSARASLSNHGATQVTFTSIAFSPNASDELSCVSTTPLPIAGGSSLGVYVEYSPSDLGVDAATLHLLDDQTAQPIDVTVRGEGVRIVDHSERWLTDDPKIDVLLV